MARCLAGLKFYTKQSLATEELAQEHFEQRLMKIGMFSLKKYQLTSMMALTISTAVEERLKSTYL